LIFIKSSTLNLTDLKLGILRLRIAQNQYNILSDKILLILKKLIHLCEI
jgi:hypothetical protein